MIICVLAVPCIAVVPSDLAFREGEHVPSPVQTPSSTAQEDNVHLRKEQKCLTGKNNENNFSRESIWKMYKQEEEMKRTKLHCLKMFQRHNLSCKGENKKGGEKKKINLCLTGLLLQGHSSLLLLLILH